MQNDHRTTWEHSAHHDRSIAHWEMRNAAEETVGVGVSYGEYGRDGKLTAMTGFFEVPGGA